MITQIMGLRATEHVGHRLLHGAEERLVLHRFEIGKAALFHHPFGLTNPVKMPDEDKIQMLHQDFDKVCLKVRENLVLPLLV